MLEFCIDKSVCDHIVNNCVVLVQAVVITGPFLA